MQAIRLIAMDMDGTLLGDNGQITAGNILALRRAVERGIHIAICSGRLHGDASYFVADAGLNTCHILSLNGACGADAPHGPFYATHKLSGEVVQSVLRTLEEADMTYGVFQPERVLIHNASRPTGMVNWGNHRGREKAPEYLFSSEAMARYLPEGACKIVTVEDVQPERLAPVRQRLERVVGLEVTSSWGNNLEMMPRGVNKGTALRELTQRLGLQPEQVMACGDYDNDLEMIEYAGCGVAMGNAVDAIKRAARFISRDHNDDGVGYAIGRFALDE